MQIALSHLDLERPKIRTTVLIFLLAGGFLAWRVWFDQASEATPPAVLLDLKDDVRAVSRNSPSSKQLPLLDPSLIEEPSNVPLPSSSEFHKNEFVGTPLDPNEGSGFLASDRIEIKNVGLPLDPDATDLGNQSANSSVNQEIIQIGEPLDPEM